jgi:predicted dehydrogenase
MKNKLSRRQFIKTVAGASALAFAAPRIVSAQNVNSKIGFAFIGTAGRGGEHLGLANGSDGICVAYCDVDKSRWGDKNKKGIWLPDRWPNAGAYQDYRKMFEKSGRDIDAVTVAVPDHTHAPASLMAMKMGKHVYCEKPLTWSIEEARLMAKVCAEKKLATQMGNQGHANRGNRVVVEWVQGGIIGDVKEVHTWTNRPVWKTQGITRRPPTQPVPANLDWDCWIGAAPFRQYHDGLHSFDWRGWFDFGCGTVGDMGCHTWDCVNWSMAPDYPISVEVIAIQGCGYPETYPKQVHFKWEFPEKKGRKAFTAHWYSGGLKPPAPPEMEGKGLDKSASLFFGTKGVLYVQGDYGNSPRLIPASAMKNRPESKIKIEPSPGHHEEWVMAVKGEKPWDFPKSNFLYAGPMTELMLLGCVAIKLNKPGFKIECDPVKREVKTKEAIALLSRKPRQGWSYSV